MIAVSERHAFDRVGRGRCAGEKEREGEKEVVKRFHGREGDEKRSERRIIGEREEEADGSARRGC